MKITRRQLRQIIKEEVNPETPPAESAFDPKSPIGVEILTLRNDIKLLEKKVEYLLNKDSDTAREAVLGKT